MHRYGSATTNTVVGFRVQADGTLAQASVTPSGTRYPRGVEICGKPGEEVLLVAGQGSANMMSFAVAPGGDAGTLRPLGEVASGLATPTTIACAA